MPFLVPLHVPHDVINMKVTPPSTGHTFSYTVSKFEVNQTSCPKLSTILYTTHSCSCSPECQPLHLLPLICHPWPTKCQYMYHSLLTTGLQVTRCESFAYSSASLIPGPKFASSRLRKNLIIYSASWPKRVMLPWTDGYQQMKHPKKFLDYIKSTLNNKISPQVHVYELEDIIKRSDKSINELVDQICQLTCRAQIGNGSDAVIESEVQHRLIWAIPDTDIKLHKQLLKVSCDKKVLHL